jgi:hypothetical protein
MKSPPQVHTDLARNERSAFPSFRRNLLQRAEERPLQADKSVGSVEPRHATTGDGRPPLQAAVARIRHLCRPRPVQHPHGRSTWVQIVVALVAIGAPLAEPRLTLPILLVSDRSASALKKWRLPAFPFVTSQLRYEQRGRNASAGPVVAPD